MKIDHELLHKTAHLARLHFREEDADAMMQSMSEILDWVESLNALDTDGVEPLTHMSFEENVMREDGTQVPLKREDALSVAPKEDGTFFRVPKVLE